MTQTLSIRFEVRRFSVRQMICRFLVSLTALALGGCVAFPHLDQLSPQVSGRVVDATTQAPLTAARVEFVEYPSMAVITDAKGEFVLRETRKPELFIPLGETDAFDLGSRVSPRLRISMEGYQTVEVDAAKPENWEARDEAPQRSAYQTSRGPFYVRPIALERVR